MKKKKIEKVSENPSGFSVVAREIKKDKKALVSLTILTFIVVSVIIYNLYMRLGSGYAEFQNVDILNRFLEPGENGFLLGTESSGQSVFALLMLGTMNSLIIAVLVTAITVSVGTLIGLTIAYYGGIVDNLVMRFVDFLVIIPYLMVIIVFVTIYRGYGVFSFILMLSALSWMGVTRLVRSKALSESRRDYVLASKTMGTSDLKIMFKGILPNIGSIIIVDATLSLVANMGLEVALTYLGFGLPVGTPSIGTLLSYAKSTDIMLTKPHIWVPASVMILVLALSINYIGQALRRSLDAKQRA